MDIDITTPALLFPAISLLLLAYTNKYLAIASLIRQLYNRLHNEKKETLKQQIGNLRRRVSLIIYMQIFAVLSITLCMFAMFSLFLNSYVLGSVIFSLSLLAMIASLLLSLYELRISGDALNIELQDMEKM
jgi:hypothetical protein